MTDAAPRTPAVASTRAGDRAPEGAPASPEEVEFAQHERLLQSLLHGEALPGPPGERRLIQTHISSLVLDGAFAYKLRKPLRLAFLDFSTAELRRDDCLAELRLNRRTAPELYLDVVPIVGTTDSPRLGEAGDAAPQAFDWVLRMCRFDEADLLDNMAHAGTLNADHIDALAQQVAAFHQALPPSPPSFGAPETAQRWLLDALDTLSASPAAQPHGERIAALHEWSLREFERLAPLLAQRRTEGFVRECHGDLHLANIVLVEGEPRPFDGIEFNAELRHIDVMSDIAFTFMDLQRHGLPRLAWRFVGGYVEHTGDVEGLALLRLFAVYRALVRARVALLRAAQGEAARKESGALLVHDEGSRDAALAAFERDLALAEQLAAPRNDAPRLVLTCGISGSGKSTVAQLLAQALGGVRLRSDVERKRLHGMAPTARPAPEQTARLYSLEATRLTYERLGTLARTLLRAGINAVVDAAALKRDERDALRAIAAEEGATFVLLECVAPDAVLRERLARRQQANRDASDADSAVLDLQSRVSEPVAPQEGALTLSTDCDLATLAHRCDALATQIAQPASTIHSTSEHEARP